MGGFVLPEAPGHLKGAVKAWAQAVVMPTYKPRAAEKLPMFLEKRVYQGSSGKVYPLPFVDRISEEKEDVEWEAIHLENEYVRLMILPQLGGRIHVGLDKTNGYDFFYRQNVIKPALVGLAGPWISGGVEFNWPQHHRPSTFMPVDWTIEEHGDRSVTVWCSEHEPMNRMKGMHGVCLRPGSSLIELKVRLYNRTELVQTFLWWANAAVRVHERYQAFFPPDVMYVADHAKRAMSRFPLCDGKYYGVDYGKNAEGGMRNVEWGDGTRRRFVPPVVDGKRMYPANDLRWYANIPVPTSYMAMGSKEDFFGGYDHAKEAGVVHVADHRIAPGKKLWTWGNHEFGYAWDRNLTDGDGPYAELMAGVFTDNQPDFSWLMPGETRGWSQYWYPIQKIGPVQAANTAAAVSLTEVHHEDTEGTKDHERKKVRMGVVVTSRVLGARVELRRRGEVVFEKAGLELGPGQALVEEVAVAAGTTLTELRVALVADGGRDVVAYQPEERIEGEVPAAARGPALPADVRSEEELYLIGVHLEQYRHATRMPEEYWREALRREPGDARCNNAMGLWHLRRGEFELAVECFEKAIATLTRFNPNPRDGEVFYNLGVALQYLGKVEDAYAALSKAIWSEAWRPAAQSALARIEFQRGNWWKGYLSLARGNRGLVDPRRTLFTFIALQKSQHPPKSAIMASERALSSDLLDATARFFYARPVTSDPQTRLDIALECTSAGLYEEALLALRDARPDADSGCGPLLDYYRAFILAKLGRNEESCRAREAAAAVPGELCFPSRVEEIAILQEAMAKNPEDARAPYYLGCLLYHKRRHQEAIGLWEKAIKLDRTFAPAWRNVGIGYYNILHDKQAAKGAYTWAFQMDPKDARIFYERDQLWKRMSEPPEKRLEEMEQHADLVKQRDDLTAEYCTVLNQLERYEEALAVLEGRRFQPWEGGEGLVLRQWVRANVGLARRAIWHGGAEGAAEARRRLEAALHPPENLGEAWHLLANRAEVHYWLGMACRLAGDSRAAEEQLAAAAGATGDFQEMSVRAYSEMSYYAGLALGELGRRGEADVVFDGMAAYGRELAKREARIDYFATSLPAMLLFEDDLPRRQMVQGMLLEALGRAGTGGKKAARRLLEDILREDPNHAVAADFVAAIEWAER